MKAQNIKRLIIIDCIIGFTVLCLNFSTSPTSVYNFIVFLLLVYFYHKTQNKMYVPYFILQFFVFSLVFLNRLFPHFLNDRDPFVNTTMIILGISGVLFMLAVAFGIRIKKQK